MAPIIQLVDHSDNDVEIGVYEGESAWFFSAVPNTTSGDRMFLLTVGRSFEGADGNDATTIPDPAWTLLDRYTVGGLGYADRFQANLYTKVADAGDEAGTTRYIWRPGGPYVPGIPPPGWEGETGVYFGGNFSLSCCTFAGGGNWVFSAPVKAVGDGNSDNLSLTAPSVDGSVLTFAVTRTKTPPIDASYARLDLLTPTTLGGLESNWFKFIFGQAEPGSTVDLDVYGTNISDRYQALFAVGVSEPPGIAGAQRDSFFAFKDYSGS
jgi:hypothetical protein